MIANASIVRAAPTLYRAIRLMSRSPARAIPAPIRTARPAVCRAARGIAPGTPLATSQALEADGSVQGAVIVRRVMQSFYAIVIAWTTQKRHGVLASLALLASRSRGCCGRALPQQCRSRSRSRNPLVALRFSRLDFLRLLLLLAVLGRRILRAPSSRHDGLTWCCLPPWSSG